MPRRPCLGFRAQTCDTLTSHPSSRCDVHRPMYEAARRPNRPSARQRGYDSEHDALRAQLLPLAIGTPCPRCGQPMLEGQELDLGHPEGAARSVAPDSRADRIEHARCNRSAGAA